METHQFWAFFVIALIAGGAITLGVSNATMTGYAVQAQQPTFFSKFFQQAEPVPVNHITPLSIPNEKITMEIPVFLEVVIDDFVTAAGKHVNNCIKTICSDYLTGSPEWGACTRGCAQGVSEAVG